MIFFQQVMRLNANTLGVRPYTGAYKIGAGQFIKIPIFKGDQITGLDAGLVPNILYGQTQ